MSDFVRPSEMPVLPEQCPQHGRDIETHEQSLCRGDLGPVAQESWTILGESIRYSCGCSAYVSFEGPPTGYRIGAHVAKVGRTA